MINYLVSYDEHDPELGEYFGKCEGNLCDFLSENEHLVKEYHKIPSRLANQAYVDLRTSHYAGESFIFIAYTHGNDDEVVCNNESVVNLNNSHRFVNAFVYSTSCSTAKKLGPKLIEDGCLAFVGYKEPSIAFHDKLYQQISINCENYALILWLSQDIELKQAVAAMKRYMTNQIQHLDVMLAGDMVANREALTCLGNQDLKRHDIYIE